MTWIDDLPPSAKRWILIFAGAIAVVALAGSLTGCISEPIRQAESRGDVQVSVMAEFEGIRLYRVYADGRWIYVARVVGSAGESIRAGWVESCGKGCHRDVSVDTLGDK